MERLDLSKQAATFGLREAAIHVARYSPILKFAKGRHVLDIGCGEGYSSQYFLNSGALSYTGVDLDEGAISKAKLRFNNSKLTFVCASSEEFLGRSNKKYDLITSVEALEHFHSPSFIMSEIYRSCSFGGFAYVTFPNDYMYFGLPETLNKYHLHQLSFEEFSDLVDLSGFSQKRLGVGFSADGFLNSSVDEQMPSATLMANLVTSGDFAENILCLGHQAPQSTEAAYFFAILSNASIPNVDFGGTVFTAPSSEIRHGMGVELKRRLSRNLKLCLVSTTAETFPKNFNVSGVDINKVVIDPSRLLEGLLLNNFVRGADVLHFMGNTLAQQLFDAVKSRNNLKSDLQLIVGKYLSLSHITSRKDVLGGSPGGFFEGIYDGISGTLNDDDIRTISINALRNRNDNLRLARRLWCR